MATKLTWEGLLSEPIVIQNFFFTSIAKQNRWAYSKLNNRVTTYEAYKSWKKPTCSFWWIVWENYKIVYACVMYAPGWKKRCLVKKYKAWTTRHNGILEKQDGKLVTSFR